MRANVSFSINYDSIRRKIESAIANSIKIKRLAYVKAYGRYMTAKRAMLKEFDRSNITQELISGPNALNISGTLDGYGNLFSFIGFEQGDNPTEALRQLLELGTSMTQTVYRNKAWYFKVSLPTREVIEENTQMPWESGNSWAYAVERYISGLGHYMYKKNLGASSRSGTGLQIGISGTTSYYDYLEDANFSPKPYISEILKNFRVRINKKD